MDKMSFHSDGFEGFRRRAMENAKAADGGKQFPSQASSTFRSSAELRRVLSPRRILILQCLAAHGPQPFDSLRETLGCETAALKRDLSLLRRVGALSIKRRTQQGAQETWVKPAATRFEFIFSIGQGESDVSLAEYAVAS